MITIKITELGNNMQGYYIFNEYNQLAHHFKRGKKDKQRHIDRLKNIYMKKGQSVYLKDETI